MSLNDNAMDGIETDGVDGIIPPSTINKTQDPVILEANVDNPQADSDKITPEFLATLPEMDITFKVISEQNEKLVDMETVEAGIIGDDSISQPKAEEIGMAFEGFLSSGLRLNEFTRTPSKTNLQYAKKHMAGKIKLAQESLLSSFQAFVEEPLASGVEYLTKVRELYLPSVEEQCSSLRSMAMRILSGLAENKDLVVPYKDKARPEMGDFVNIGTMDIQLLQVNNILNPKKDMSVVNQAVINIHALLDKNHVLRCLLWSSTQDGTPTVSLTPGEIVKSTGHTTSIIGLFQFFSHPLLPRMLDDLDENLYESIEVVQKLQEDGRSVQTDVRLVQDFVVNNGRDLISLQTDINNYCSVISTLLLLAPNVAELAEVFTDY